MVSEKRKEHRIKTSLPIRINYKGSEVSGTTGNISRLGAYAEIGRHIPVGQDIDIIIAIPDYAQDLSLTGQVRCKGNIFRSSVVRQVNSIKYYGTGIFFTKFSEDTDKGKLSNYIDFLLSQEGRGIKEGIKRWRNKRSAAKRITKAKGVKAGQDNLQAETLNLLKQVLALLEEIYRLLKDKE